MKNPKVRPNLKTCSECGESKSVYDDYYWNKRPKSPYPIQRCKDCHSAYMGRVRKKRKYGITQDDWDRMFTEQSGKCAVCEEAFSDQINVDHNHETGQVRGLLCSLCNWLLGMAKEDETILLKAVQYLAVHNQAT